MRKSCNRNQRNGVTAVEFAVVAPLIFLIVFSIFEISRLQLIDGQVTGAVLTGLRKATILDSTSIEVDSLIRSELSRCGVVEATIAIAPADFSDRDSEISIAVAVPLNRANGFVGSRLVASNSNVKKSITFRRESE